MTKIVYMSRVVPDVIQKHGCLCHKTLKLQHVYIREEKWYLSTECNLYSEINMDNTAKPSVTRFVIPELYIFSLSDIL